MNIVIPMAGEGSRFVKAGYTTPKPFIDVKGRPMIERVMDNLATPEARFILIVRRSHLEGHKKIMDRLKRRYPVVLLTIDQLTEGTACTVLFARELINTDTPLLIANSDQLVDVDLGAYYEDARHRCLDGSILTFQDPFKDSKWSFARLDENNLVTEVREKVPISDIATVGIYLFSQGRTFVDAAIDMVVRNDRVGNEFYTCPVYNYAVKNGKTIGIFNIPFEAMHGLGTPEDLDRYLLQKGSV